MYPPASSGAGLPSGAPYQDPTSLGPAAAMSAAADVAQVEHPLRFLVAKWVEKIKLAKQFKEDKFGKDAAEAMAFFCGPYDFLYTKKYARTSPAFSVAGEEDEDIPAPGFQMTVNKVAEAVQIFGPVLYHRNPTRQVNPREIPLIPPEIMMAGQMADPMMQMQAMQMQGQEQATIAVDKLRAALLQAYLNWTPTELDLKTNSRMAIDEAIIKGAGCLWTEVYTPKGQAQGQELKLVGSFYDSVDHLLMDPDAENFADCQWIARRCIHPAWRVEQDYGLEPGTLRGAYESADMQAELSADPDGSYRRNSGGTADLVTYWKIYSKMGVGGRLQGVPDNVRATLDQFGDYCYLVLCENVPYPLNMPTDLIASADPAAPEQILSRLDWPTPFWADDDWPVTLISFHNVPRSPWPMGHFKPAMGELKFLNWAYSFMAGKIRNTCRDFLAILKAAGEEMKEKILHGKDLTLIEIEQNFGTIGNVVSFLQHPQMNGDIWKVIQAVTTNFEKRTGLTELVYGESESQMRSAAEADLKGSQLQIRPDDMAQKVEDAMTLVARKEAIAARIHLTPLDVAPYLGQTAATYWQQYVVSSDLFELVRQLDYRIEAGSSKKPNKARDASNMDAAMQQILQPLFGYAQSTGDVRPFNALIRDWAKSRDLRPDDYMLMAPPPPPATPEAGQAGKAGGPPGRAAGPAGGQGGGPPQAAAA